MKREYSFWRIIIISWIIALTIWVVRERKDYNNNKIIYAHSNGDTVDAYYIVVGDTIHKTMSWSSYEALRDKLPEDKHNTGWKWSPSK